MDANATARNSRLPFWDGTKIINYGEEGHPATSPDEAPAPEAPAEPDTLKGISDQKNPPVPKDADTLHALTPGKVKV